MSSVSSPVQPKGEALQEILNQFSTRTPEALLAMAATREGLSIASVKQQIISDEEDALAVAGARILDMAAEVNNQLNQGQIGRILIEGIERTTIVMGAGRDIVFVVVVPADAKLGLAMLSIQNTAKLIADLYN